MGDRKRKGDEPQLPVPAVAKRARTGPGAPGEACAARKRSLRTWDRVARCFEQPLGWHPLTIEVALTRGICSVPNLLSGNECERIADLVRRDWLWKDPLHHDFAAAQRTGTRVLVRMDEMALELWKRVEHVVQEHFSDVAPFGFNVQQGRWKAVGLNPCFRLAQYEPGDHFAIHRDAQFTPNDQLRSALTLLVYLTESDGDTVFLLPKHEYERVAGETPNEEVERVGIANFDELVVSPCVGKAVLFDHDTLHRARPPSTTKLILRTDVVFACDKLPTPNPATAKLEKLAKEMYTEATNKALDGDAEGAGVLYERGLSVRQAQRAHLAPPSIASLAERVLGHIAQNTTFFAEEDLACLAKVCKSLRAVVKMKGSAPPQHSSIVSSAPFIPRLLSRTGSVCEFQFPDEGFFAKHKAKCVRVAAMYAIALFGHPANARSVVVNYDPDRDCALGVSIEWLLKCVFHSLPCRGTLFHVTAPSEATPHAALGSQTRLRSMQERFGASLGLDDDDLADKLGDEVSVVKCSVHRENEWSDHESDSSPLDDEVDSNDSRVEEAVNQEARSCVAELVPPGPVDIVVGDPQLPRSVVLPPAANERAIRSGVGCALSAPGFSELLVVESSVGECVPWGYRSWEKPFLHMCSGTEAAHPDESECEPSGVPFLFDNLVFDFGKSDLELVRVDGEHDTFVFSVVQRDQGVMHAGFPWRVGKSHVPRARSARLHSNPPASHWHQQARLRYTFEARVFGGRTELQTVSVHVLEGGRVRTEFEAVVLL